MWFCWGDPAGWRWRASSPLRFLHLFHSHTSPMKEHEKQRSEKLTCTDGYTLLPDTTASEIKKHASSRNHKSTHLGRHAAPKTAVGSETFIYLCDSDVKLQEAKQWLAQETVWCLSAASVGSKISAGWQVYNKNDCWPLQVCPYLLHTGTAGGYGRVSKWDLSCSSLPDAQKRWKLRT